MPTYEYLCEASDRVVAASHTMTQKLKTWGRLCKHFEITSGKTGPKAKVTKLMSAGFVNTVNSSAAKCEMPACGSGMCGVGQASA
jgi:hypothetical protein